MRTPPTVAIRRLAVARFISVAGSMAAYTALIDLVFRRTDGSAIALSLTTILTMGAVGIFGPVGGIIADRWDRKRAMVASDLVGGALFAVLAFVGPIWLILVVALLTAVASTPFRAGSTASIPNLVGDPELIAKANGRLAIGTNLGITLGPTLGGVLVGAIGAGPVFLLNAASFAISAVLVWRIRADFGGVGATEREGAPADDGVLAGFRFIRRERVLFVVTVAWIVLVLGMGLSIVADRPVAEAFGVGSLGFGIMLGLYGVGAVSGSWFASRLSARTEPTALVVGFGLAAIAGLTIGFAPAFWIVLACNLVWGVGDAVTVVAKTGILQRRTPDAVRGRVAAANESIAHVALVAGFLAAGPTIETLGAQPTYAVGGAAALLAGLLTWSIVGPMRRDAERADTTERGPDVPTPVDPVLPS